MHRLSLVNQKGGCGKTTTAVNLAGALARRGARVLLVDLDPQAHATLSVGCAVERGEPTIGDVLLDRATLEEVTHRVPGDFDLVPATEDVAEFEDTAARLIWPERLLSRALDEVRTQYDFAIVDCPPRVDGVLTANALRACDTALLIVEAGAFALQGAVKAIDILDRICQDLESEFQLRVLCTLFDRRTRLGKDLLIGMQAQFGDLLFDTVIHTSQRLREAAASGVPVQVLDPRSRAADDFDELAKEVEAHAAAFTSRIPAAPVAPRSVGVRPTTLAATTPDQPFVSKS